MSAQKTTVNGQEVAFADLSFVIAGASSPLFGVTEVTYETERPGEFHKGAGDRNVSWSRGGPSHSGSITLLHSEVRKIQKGSAVSSLTELRPIDIVITSSFDGILIETVVLQKCLITKDPRSLKSGDSKMEVKLDLAIGGIQIT